MPEQSILIIIAFLSLCFVWLLWARSQLVHRLRRSRISLEQLQSEVQKKHDTIPYLLESIRGVENYESAWAQILAARQSMNPDELDAVLLPFLQQTHSRDLSFLEAKKDIYDLIQLIADQEDVFNEDRESYQRLKKRFPYSLASAIFGLPNIDA